MHELSPLPSSERIDTAPAGESFAEIRTTISEIEKFF